jgi:ubiquinone/menaquinone biosynthesis C-methylase UbiE
MIEDNIKRDYWLKDKDLKNISSAMWRIHCLEEYFGKKLYEMKFLEVGCGRGHFTNLLQYCGIDCIGLDALNNFEDKKINTEKKYFMNGSLFQLPFEENSFDLVHERMVFDDMTEFQKLMDEAIIPAMKEIIRVIKPQGYYSGNFPDKWYDHYHDHFVLVNTHLPMEFFLWQKK